MAALTAFFFLLPGEAYVHDPVSPRLVQLSQGCARLHFNLPMSADTYQSVIDRVLTFCVGRARMTEVSDFASAQLGTEDLGAIDRRWTRS